MCFPSLSFHKTRMPRLACLALLALALRPAFALGIDKLWLEIDANGKFSSASQVVLFNDTNDVVHVTGRPLAWNSDEAGTLTTEPSTDLAISPATARIPAQGAAVFSVRYVGPKKEGESTFRASFRETRMPALDPDNAGQGVGAQVLAGIVVTIPVFVSDFASRAPAFKDVQATFRRTGQDTMLSVKNGGGRHVIVDAIRVGDEEIRRPRDTLFAKRQKTYTGIKLPGAGASLSLVLVNGADTRRITATEEK
jgi:P pilus assembly chaperone PapD